MAEQKVIRRLAAVLAADMVGYSRLMGLDETDTIARQKAIIAGVFEPHLAAHGGRLVKTTGDGLLIEFTSAVEAVECASKIQRDVDQRQGDVPDDRKICYRIGVNLGEIVFDGDDILGDGVNIAARLEALADPGGILVSDVVFKNVSGKLQVNFEALGPHKAKNIADPIETYRVLAEAPSSNPKRKPARKGRWLRPLAIAGIGAVVVVAGTLWWQPWHSPKHPTGAATGKVQRAGKPSIAVLPFANLSGDKDQEYFSDGLTEDLTTDLSRIAGLTVIARTSAYAFKGRALDVRTIGKELGARYLVEGSVRKAGERIRISAKLLDARSGKQVWAVRFDRNSTDLFKLQDELRAKIVESLRIKLTPQETQWLAHRLTKNPDAYDAYLRGLKAESFFSKNGNRESRAQFQKAIDLDPKFAAAYARLAQAYTLAQENGWTNDRDAYAQKALRLAKKAVSLDGELPQAHWALARVYSRAPLRDNKRSIASLRKVIELDPNYADGYAFLADRLTATGHADKALALIERGMRINPRFPFWYLFILGRTQFHLTRYEAAAKNIKKAMARNPAVPWPHRYLIATYGHLGLKDDAEWEISELKNMKQIVTIEHSRKISSIADPVYLKQYLDGLRKGGVPER